MRTMNADAFNRIANHPEVRPWIGMEDPRIDIDLTSVTRNPDNFAFLTDKEDGGYLVVKLAAGLYVAHSMALPDARGRPMASLMRKGFQCMFVETDAVEIVTQIPDGNQRAEGLSQLAGFRSTFRKEKHFPLMGERVGSQFKSLVYADWVVSGHSDARRVGQAFHEEIGRLHGLANHAHDGVHDQWVGATVMGCLEIASRPWGSTTGGRSWPDITKRPCSPRTRLLSIPGTR